MRIAMALALALGTSGAALAADPTIEYPAEYPVTAQIFDWSGAYVGVQVGGGWSKVDQPWGPTAATAGSLSQDDADGNGLIGGVHAGYNWQSGSFVFGIEADINATNIDGDDGGDGGHINGFKAKWTGSVRGRAGVAFDRLLVYGTGGYAHLRGKADRRDPGFGESHSVSFNGWTVGAGAEYAVSDNVTVRGEYRYASFGSEVVEFPASGYFEKITPKLHTIQVGLSYKF